MKNRFGADSRGRICVESRGRNASRVTPTVSSFGNVPAGERNARTTHKSNERYTHAAAAAAAAADIRGTETGEHEAVPVSTRIRSSCDFLIDEGISLCKRSRVPSIVRESSKRVETHELPKITRRETRSFSFDVLRETQRYGRCAHGPRDVGREQNEQSWQKRTGPRNEGAHVENWSL